MRKSYYYGANKFLLEHIKKPKRKLTMNEIVWVLLVISVFLNLILGWGFWKWRELVMLCIGQ
jgi:hypothetical protein